MNTLPLRRHLSLSLSLSSPFNIKKDKGARIATLGCRHGRVIELCNHLRRRSIHCNGTAVVFTFTWYRGEKFLLNAGQFGPRSSVNVRVTFRTREKLNPDELVRYVFQEEFTRFVYQDLWF